MPLIAGTPFTEGVFVCSKIVIAYFTNRSIIRIYAKEGGNDMADNINGTIGQRIMFCMAKRGIKKSAMAEYLKENCETKFDLSKLSLTLHNKRTMSITEYKHICDFLEVDYDTFLTGEAD